MVAIHALFNYTDNDPEDAKYYKKKLLYRVLHNANRIYS